MKAKLRVAICGRNLDDLKAILNRFPIAIDNENPDVVISHGGDGTLLGAERTYPGVPKCPLRDWRQNPKCKNHADEVVLDRLIAGTLGESRLKKLIAETERDGRVEGINDICVNKKIISSAVRYRLWLDDELYRGQVVGDGLVVATPFGSTGYFRNITHSFFRVGTGIAFNNSAELLDHLVVDEGTVIRLAILRGPAVVLADNDPTRIELREGDRVSIRTGDRPTLIYGLDIFRCKDCYRLRQDGVDCGDS